jgi:4-amino-4-deoxychorismate lyase
MSLLVETIKSENGNLLNTSFHNERFNRSLYALFGLKKETELAGIITVPPFALKGIFKCRVVYDDKSIETEFVPYNRRLVRSLKMVIDNSIKYSYKFTDRSGLNRLVELKGDCDEILIIQNGMVTDSSYANVIFKKLNGNWVTPSTYLLPGTMRSALLKQELITEARISLSDIEKYSEVRLINAMIGIDDSEGIPVNNLFW